METLITAALVLYAFLLALMLVYGTNTLLLVLADAVHRRRRAPAPPLPEELPFVTVQLPVYDEENVIERLLEAAGALRWPRDRLEIQLLDDSTDGTTAIAVEVLARLRQRGLQVAHLRRERRVDFKAGALQESLASCRGDFLALFDADFVPPPEFLEQAMGYFSDPEIAAIQGRWTHLNRGWSRLTEAQALGIDGHFGVEQGARMGAGWFLNFNGSAGIWRKEAILDAGGWSGDTLTEDLDLSYRVQLQGWRIAYDPDIVCPAELPTQLGAFKVQQRRWATGSMQTARKLLPAIWRSGDKSLVARIQATLHLTHYAIHPLIVLSALLSIPCLLLPGMASGARSPWTLAVPFALAMTGPVLLHVYSQWVLHRRLLRPRELGMMTLLGVGIAVSNSIAVLAAWVGPRGDFVRTPKLGVVGSEDRPRRRYRLSGDGRVQHLELMLFAYCLLAFGALVYAGVYEIAPFLLLDAVGLCWVIWRSREELAA